jgi:hypothetical protein
LTPFVYELFNVIGPKFQQLSDLDTFQVGLLPSSVISDPRLGNPKYLRHLFDGEQLHSEFRSHNHRVRLDRRYPLPLGNIRNFTCQIDNWTGVASGTSEFTFTSHSRRSQKRTNGLIRLILHSFQLNFLSANTLAGALSLPAFLRSFKQRYVCLMSRKLTNLDVPAASSLLTTSSFSY